MADTPPEFWNGLRNKTLRVLVHEMVPYTSLDGSELTGYIGELWRDLEKTLGFKSEYRLTSFTEGKRALRAGVSATADVMLSPVVLESRDLDDFDAAGPLGSSVYSLYAMASAGGEEHGAGGSSSAFYLWSWSRRLWLAYFALLALIALMLRFTSAPLIPRRRRQPDSKGVKRNSVTSRVDNVEMPWSWGTCLLTVIRAATQQDLHLSAGEGGPASQRVLLVVLLTFSSLLATAYNSVLVSRLTVAGDDPLFPDLAAVARHPRYFLCVRVNSAVYSKFLVNSSSSELQERWSRIVNRGPCHRDPKTTEDIAASICQERCVLFESDNIMSVLLSTAQRRCEMERPSPLRVYSHISILMRRGMPRAHTQLIRMRIMTMKSSGALHVLQNRLLPISDRLISGGQSAYQPVTLRHVTAPLAGYAIAAAAAALALLAELVVAYRR